MIEILNYLYLLTVNGYHWIGLPNMNIQDLKELLKSIRKYIKENKQ